MGLFVASCLQLNAQRVSFNDGIVSLKEALQKIEAVSKYKIAYNGAKLDVSRKVELNQQDTEVLDVLNQVLAETGYTYSVKGNYVIITPSDQVHEKEDQKIVTVSGKVVDEKGEPIIGANVVVSGTTNGTITDFNGIFTVNVEENATLEVSYIGFLSQKVSTKGNTKLHVVLKEDSQKLEEVVVVGYGTQKKVTLTGAVAAIKDDELITTKNENAQNMLTGKISGVRVMQKSAEPGSFNNNFDIRGMGDALIIIDGVPRDNMTRLDPNDIESISVLKDASAAIYGVRAANGVVLITTKKGKTGHVELEYSGNVGWQNPSGAVKSVSAADWMTLKNEKSMHNVNGGTLVYDLDEIEAYRNGTKQGTDWYDAVMRPLAPQTQHSLSVRGGNEKTNYYMSAGYLYQESFLRSNSLDYDRFNVRSNISSKITDRLTVDLNVSGIMDQKDQPYQNSDWIIRAMQRAPATQPIYANGNPEYLQYGWIEGDNPVAMMDADQVGYKKYNNKWF